LSDFNPITPFLTAEARQAATLALMVSQSASWHALSRPLRLGSTTAERVRLGASAATQEYWTITRVLAHVGLLVLTTLRSSQSLHSSWNLTVIFEIFLFPLRILQLAAVRRNESPLFLPHCCTRTSVGMPEHRHNMGHDGHCAPFQPVCSCFHGPSSSQPRNRSLGNPAYFLINN
jgi:hypothetical protein